MREIKWVHVVIVVILALLSAAIFQWMKIPERIPETSVSAPVTAQPEELPILPQNDLYKLNAPPSFAEELPPFREALEGSNLEPKDPEASKQKALL